MQHYNNLSECIEMCDRILRTSAFPRGDHVKPGGPIIRSENCGLDPSKSGVPPTNFYPSRTVVAQNFLQGAEVHVQSFVAMFGIVEVFDLVRDHPSCLAVVQYKTRRSAADALLAMPYCQIRGSNLVVNLLWNGPYENIGSITRSVQKSFRECAEKRVVCIGQLPRTITEEGIRRKCEKYGIVESVQVQPQEQGAFAYVVFQTAFSAAVANYCLRNSSTSSSALMLGYSDTGNPVLLGPVRVRPLDQYRVPLTAFDVRCICSRFLDYTNRLKGLFLNPHRRLPIPHFTRPGSADHCVRIPTPQVKGVSLFLEVVLFEGGPREEVTEMAYQLCRNKHLFRFSLDFGLHKPTTSYDDVPARPEQPHFLSWSALLALDLQICLPWGAQEPRLEPRVQTMNHVHSDMEHRSPEMDRSSSWYGIALRHTVSVLTSNQMDGQHRNRVKFLLTEGLPFLRLVGSCDDVNSYQIPIHVYSQVQPALKTIK